MSDPAAELIERLAALEHERWSGWMRYLFTKGRLRSGASYMDGTRGSFVIDADSVARWQRQMVTPYSELSEAEKESDRKEVRKTLALLPDIEELRRTIRNHETVMREVADTADEQSAAVLAQVEAAMTEANRQGGSLSKVWSLLAPALAMLRPGTAPPVAEGAPQSPPEHADSEYVGDHWATEECPRCALEIALGWRTTRAGGKTAAEHLRLRGYIEPEAAHVAREGVAFIKEQTSGDWRSWTGDRISRIAERADKVIRAIGALSR